MKQVDDDTPGARFRAARKRAGLTQADVASRSRVPQNTISNFETGGNDDILASKLIRMCIAVTTTAEYVLRGSREICADEEAEAVQLLRGADKARRDAAMDALRGMLTKQQALPPLPAEAATPGPRSQKRRAVNE